MSTFSSAARSLVLLSMTLSFVKGMQCHGDLCYDLSGCCGNPGLKSKWFGKATQCKNGHEYIAPKPVACQGCRATLTTNWAVATEEPKVPVRMAFSCVKCRQAVQEYCQICCVKSAWGVEINMFPDAEENPFVCKEHIAKEIFHRFGADMTCASCNEDQTKSMEGIMEEVSRNDVKRLAENLLKLSYERTPNVVTKMSHVVFMSMGLNRSEMKELSKIMKNQPSLRENIHYKEIPKPVACQGCRATLTTNWAATTDEAVPVRMAFSCVQCRQSVQEYCQDCCYRSALGARINMFSKGKRIISAHKDHIATEIFHMFGADMTCVSCNKGKEVPMKRFSMQDVTDKKKKILATHILSLGYVTTKLLDGDISMYLNSIEERIFLGKN